MKRLRPNARKLLVSDIGESLWFDWTCRHGAWNRDKLVEDLIKFLKGKIDEQKLKDQRREAG